MTTHGDNKQPLSQAGQTSSSTLFKKKHGLNTDCRSGQSGPESSTAIIIIIGLLKKTMSQVRNCAGAHTTPHLFFTSRSDKNLNAPYSRTVRRLIAILANKLCHKIEQQPATRHQHERLSHAARGDRQKAGEVFDMLRFAAAQSGHYNKCRALNS